MSAEKYTQEQILSGIWIVCSEVPELDLTFDFNISFDFDARLSEYFTPSFSSGSLGDWIGSAMGEEDAFTEFAHVLAWFFGFTCSVEEWNNYFGLNATSREEWEREHAPHFTFRRLVKFIQERAKPIPLEPITMLGKPCLTAGIFRGLEHLARQIDPKATRFGPSTPIRRCLRGVWLRLFWHRLRWMFQDQLPPPRQITLSSRGFLHSLLFKFSVGLLIAIWSGDLSGVLAGIGTTFALFIPLGVIVAYINNRLNPLPKEIETFGDLSRVLAAIIQDQQSEAASCSTP
ncbi:MAG TPA: hypothetical protein VMF69_14405 [Gemmataceae bacterium]|nr:hypothetical protein [Gemmataceae bacterium]